MLYRQSDWSGASLLLALMTLSSIGIKSILKKYLLVEREVIVSVSSLVLTSVKGELFLFR